MLTRSWCWIVLFKELKPFSPKHSTLEWFSVNSTKTANISFCHIYDSKQLFPLYLLFAVCVCTRKTTSSWDWYCLFVCLFACWVIYCWKTKTTPSSVYFSLCSVKQCLTFGAPLWCQCPLSFIIWKGVWGWMSEMNSALCSKSVVIYTHFAFHSSCLTLFLHC